MMILALSVLVALPGLAVLAAALVLLAVPLALAWWAVAPWRST